MATHYFYSHRCPSCYSKLNVATNLDNEPPPSPNPGDITICAQCLELLEFQSDMSVKQIDIMSLEPEVQKIIIQTLPYVVQYRK